MKQEWLELFEKSCIVIAGGDLSGKIRIPDGALVICADCGYRHAKAQGIVPDVLIGDFDSYTEELPKGIKILRHPVMKDETDTYLALQYGKEQGCTEFVLYGGFGGERIDHSFANLQVMKGLVEEGFSCIMYHGRQMMWFLSGEEGRNKAQFLSMDEGFSVFAVSEEVTGLTIRGAKYCVENITLQNSFPLGVSNHSEGTHVKIQIRSGILLIVVRFCEDWEEILDMAEEA